VRRLAVTQIPNHGHCKVCGRAVKFGDDTCSAKCQEQFETVQKKRRNMLWFIYAMMGLAIVVLLLQLGGAGG
jgi:predicted nucleic acid-binding Zn ribbon protein